MSKKSHGLAQDPNTEGFLPEIDLAAREAKDLKQKCWRSNHGNRIDIADMTKSHIQNVLNLFRTYQMPSKQYPEKWVKLFEDELISRLSKPYGINASLTSTDKSQLEKIAELKKRGIQIITAPVAIVKTKIANINGGWSIKETITDIDSAYESICK